MDNRLEQDALIEDALKTYPLVPMPHDITADVMAHIQKEEGPAFLTWSDFVLSLVGISCIGALLFAVHNLPPLMLVKLRIQGILLYQGFLVNARWLFPAALSSLASIILVLIPPVLYRTAIDHGR